MNFRNILKIAAFGAAAYGLYKLGESQGKKQVNSATDNSNDLVDWVDDVIRRNQMAFNEQVDFVREQIMKLKNKPNKTVNDTKNINKLNEKLNNLRNSK